MSLSPDEPSATEDLIHGVRVRDPYRWLEQRDLPQTQHWLSDQQEYCDQYFSRCGDMDPIRKRVAEYLDVEVVDQATSVGERYFYRCRKAGQEQGSIYVRDGRGGKNRLLVNPGDGGPFASVGIYRISEDGRYIAYEFRHGGQDRKGIRFADADNGVILPDQIALGYAKGLTFDPDRQGFYYCHETLPGNSEHTIDFQSFNRSGVNEAVFRAPRSSGSRLVLVSDHVHLGAFLMRETGIGEVADFWIARRAEPTVWRLVFACRQPPQCPVLSNGQLFELSYSESRHGRVVELSQRGAWIRTIVSEPDAPIQQVRFSGGLIYTLHRHDLTQSLLIRSFSGADHGEVVLPTGGTVRLLPNLNESGGLFYTHESFTQPIAIYEYMPAVRQSELWHQRSAPKGMPDISVNRVRYASVDGTEVPMTIVRTKDRADAQPAPAVMSSYGGFGVASTPQFSVLVSILLEHGALFALPHVRGGGEFGHAWHEAARGRKRQASIDDFIAGAEWLCDNKLTSPEMLAIFGGSNSGLLVGAAMTQRSGLFRAVLCIAPLLDMVRYEQFGFASRWKREYGTVDNADDFRALHSYSPYHRIEEEIDYPAVLFVSGDQDDRCSPAHVRKMAARLQGRPVQQRPVVVDYSEQRGHSPELPLSVRTEALTRRIAFLLHELKIVSDKGGHVEPNGD